jgi:hypothetical protein
MMLTRLLAALALTGLAISSAQAQELDGVWRSEGYGDVFQIQGPAVKMFQVTATTCVAGPSAEREPGANEGREATFETVDGGVFFIRAGGAADHKLLRHQGASSDVRLSRVPRLPAACNQPTPDTPAANFEVFARTWAENYITFDQRRVDWNEVVRANRPKVTSSTTPEQLFDILSGMIEPFHDHHTYIEASNINRVFQGNRVGSDRLLKANGGEFRSKTMPALWAITNRLYITTPFRDFCKANEFPDGYIQYAHVDDRIGYLRIKAFGCSSNLGFAQRLKAFDSALDEIFSDPGLQGLVIDVRINFGGSDTKGVLIASRLATQKYLAYTKVAHDPVDGNRWTPGAPIIVEPSSRPGFHGPVVLLTGLHTVSAGETFTQALMGRTPHVTRIGENTQGVFSDVLDRKLPNGWGFGLPNEVFRTQEGKTFDVDGIPPDINVPVFADADVAAGTDPAMARALQLLRQATSSKR